MNRSRGLKRGQAEKVYGWAFISPSLLLLLTFCIIPVVIGIFYGFCKYNGTSPAKWIGLKNYAKLFKDDSVMAAFRNTLKYIVICVPALTVIPMIIAEVLAKKFPNRLGEFFRGIYFIPCVCSASLVSNIWYYIFMADSDSLANVVLSFFGIAPQSWLNNKLSAFLVICFVFVWKNFGYFLVIYYAAIMDISRNIYEAAATDGASLLQQFWYITVPNLKTTAYLVLTMATIWSFQLFDISYSMTGGGPANATNTLTLEIYDEFTKWKLGYSSAIAMLLTFMVLVVTVIQRLAFREKVRED